MTTLVARRQVAPTQLAVLGAVALALCTAAFGGAQLLRGAAGAVTAGRSANATTVPAAAAPAISAALGRDEAAYHVVNLRAANPQQRFTTSFKSGGGGDQLGRRHACAAPQRPRTPGRDERGRGGGTAGRHGRRQLRPRRAARVDAKTRPLGLEQGFTVLARPRGANGPAASAFDTGTLRGTETCAAPDAARSTPLLSRRGSDPVSLRA